MPYSNIVFIKLFLSLFEEDDRFLYQLNESQQLLYIKMLYMAGSTNNKITKNINFIKAKINYSHENSCFLADLERIQVVFPNGFREGKDCYYFKNFNELHNYIGKSKGNPKEIQSIVPEKRRIREEEDKIRGERFNEFCSKYPKPVNVALSYHTYKEVIKKDSDMDDVLIALENYKKSDEAKKGFIKNCDNWLQEWRGWLKIKPKTEYRLP